jgi:hypothetical protein
VLSPIMTAAKELLPCYFFLQLVIDHDTPYIRLFRPQNSHFADERCRISPAGTASTRGRRLFSSSQGSACGPAQVRCPAEPLV